MNCAVVCSFSPDTLTAHYKWEKFPPPLKGILSTVFSNTLNSNTADIVSYYFEEISVLYFCYRGCCLFA